MHSTYNGVQTVELLQLNVVLVMPGMELFLV